ncbi:RNA 3'-terminal phosphate cyclase [Dongia deserti]|uniref:RNA 3'-terminal phosphate cyclase n=1 Tax=Dongia deserti TaxID=2268030 RepID=UPI000E655C1E|nr:RNA 3'-terminal phosphate cyclase [Dongia deserti]
MIVIDGAAGEGGGQVLRTSLALAMVTGQPFRIERIRAGRRKPGLMRQHLTAVLAATQICGGTAIGAEPGSTTLEFTPGKVRGGDYRFAIGTAGSTILVLQTILLPLLQAGERSRLVLEGGTHNPHAPSFAFLERAFLPQLARMGAEVSVKLVRPGFYPAGGGRIEVEIAPLERLLPLHVPLRGALQRTHAEALVVNLPGSIGERELVVIANRLKWSAEDLKLRTDKQALGPGNVLTLFLEFATIIQVLVAFGEQGVSAEAVANRAAGVAARLLKVDAAIEPHLADQLLLPIALAGAGSFTTLALTSHAKTNIEVIRRFMDVSISAMENGEDLCAVHVAT